RLCVFFFLFFFFFFQAEDGIRDFHVTGVQTCALPIFPVLGSLDRFPGDWLVQWFVRDPRGASLALGAVLLAAAAAAGYGAWWERSEERRVGKEGRARGVADQEKRERWRKGDGAGDEDE